MVCLGLEPGAAGWKAQTNPLSYGGTPQFTYHYIITFVMAFRMVTINSNASDLTMAGYVRMLQIWAIPGLYLMYFWS